MRRGQYIGGGCSSKQNYKGTGARNNRFRVTIVSFSLSGKKQKESRGISRDCAWAEIDFDPSLDLVAIETMRNGSPSATGLDQTVNPGLRPA
jgi:hypothetical protein